MHPHPLFPPRLLAAIAVAAAMAGWAPFAASASGTGHAGGFGEPSTISGRDEVSGIAEFAMAPTGRTAVIYTRFSKGSPLSDDLRLTIGSSPDQMGPPKALRPPGLPRNKAILDPELVARPNGGFVLCFTYGASQGCSVAGPTTGLGRVKPLTGPVGSLSAIARPDGSVVLVRTARIQPADVLSRTTTTVQILGADDQLAPAQVLARESAEEDRSGNSPAHAVADDGTVAIEVQVADGPGFLDPDHPGVRLLAPGATMFGPPIMIPDAPIDSDVTLLGGPLLTVGHATGRSSWTVLPQDATFRQLGTDGVFVGPPMVAPGMRSGVEAAPVVLPGGGLFAITSELRLKRVGEGCTSPASGRIGAGPLVAPGVRTAAARLSGRGTIAWRPQGAALLDGTVLATWTEAESKAGDTRVGTAIRAPGAANFGASRRLRSLVGRDAPRLVTAGSHAAILLAPTNLYSYDRGGSSVALSTYRPNGPVAKSASRAKHPGTSCD